MSKDFSPQEIERAKTDSQIFAEIFQFFAPQVFRYVAVRINQRGDAEDLTSQIWEQIVKSFPKFKAEHAGSFPAWIFRIAKNKLTDFYRKKRIKTVDIEKIVNLSEDSETSISVLKRKELLVVLTSHMNKLSKKQREVVELKFFTDLKNKEIAQVLKTDERTVASNLFRGLKKLRELLGPDAVNLLS